MIDQAKVTSGFDVEFLMGETFIQAFLLTSLETGAIPWSSESSGSSGTPPAPYRTATIIHPPESVHDMRLYDVYEPFVDHEHPFRDIAAAYSAHEDDLAVTILENDPRGAHVAVRVYPTVLDLMQNPPGVLIGNLLAIDLAMSFEIVSTPRADGLLGDIGIRLTLVDVSGDLIDAIETLRNQPDPPPLPSRADILAQLKATIDRRVPFAVSGGGALQRIETRVFGMDADHPAAIGVYIDLALRDGPAPTDILDAARGDVTLAQNFLENGRRMAFGLPATTFALLSDDLTFKMAVPKESDPSHYHYPIMDGDTQIGKIYGITVRPGFDPTSGTVTHTLVIDISGEYAVDNWFDPDFHLRLTLTPKVDARGVFDFDIDIDLSLSTAATLIPLFLGLALSVFLPQLGLPLFFLTIVGIKAIEHYGAEAAGAAVTGPGGTTSFLDTLPHKLVVETRRWDPLYVTDHRLEIGEVDVLVTSAGFAMDAGTLFLGTRTRAAESMVIRSETRAVDGEVDGLIYRAPDIARVLSTDIPAVAAAVDRMPYTALLAPGGLETHRVQLTIGQVNDRIDAGDRHIADLDYRAMKVHVVANQISRLLAVSQREVDESPKIARDALRSEYRAQHAATLRPDAIAQLETELGRTPTEQEIRDRVDRIVAEATEPAVTARAGIELDRRLAFDLRPREFAALQRTGILTLGRDQLEIRETPRGTVFYRDYERPFEPDTPTWDNLTALPRYAPTDS